MVGVMSFSKDKHEKFCRCKKCFGETKHQKMDDSELVFEDVLHREFQKSNGRKNNYDRRNNYK